MNDNNINNNEVNNVSNNASGSNKSKKIIIYSIIGIIVVAAIVAGIIFAMKSKNDEFNDELGKLSAESYKNYVDDYGIEIKFLAEQYYLTYGEYPSFDDIKDELDNDIVSCKINKISSTGNINVGKCKIKGYEYNPHIKYEYENFNANHSINNKDDNSTSIDDDTINDFESKLINDYVTINDVAEKSVVNVKKSDTVYAIASNKNNLNGHKLGNTGVIQGMLCSDKKYNYKFVNFGSNNGKLVILDYNGEGNNEVISIPSYAGDPEEVYLLGVGECDIATSYFVATTGLENGGFYKLFIEDSPFGTNISDIMEPKVDMLYVLRVNTTVCDEACNPSVANYLIGQSGNEFYVFDKDGRMYNTKNCKFGSETYKTDDGISTVYGTVIITNFGTTIEPF